MTRHANAEAGTTPEQEIKDPPTTEPQGHTPSDQGDGATGEKQDDNDEADEADGEP